MNKTLLLFSGLAILSLKIQARSPVTDIDGNVHNIVTIGKKDWMKKKRKPSICIPLPTIKRMVFNFGEDEKVQFYKLLILKDNPLKINILKILNSS